MPHTLPIIGVTAEFVGRTPGPRGTPSSRSSPAESRPCTRRGPTKASAPQVTQMFGSGNSMALSQSMRHQRRQTIAEFAALVLFLRRCFSRVELHAHQAAHAGLLHSHAIQRLR